MLELFKLLTVNAVFPHSLTSISIIICVQSNNFRIHMKAYREKFPVMIIGGCAGSFLGEYQAGGLIIVLGLHKGHKRIVGNFPCTGMHGGKMFLRGSCEDIAFPGQVTARCAATEDLEQIREYLSEYCADFGYSADTLLSDPFTVITPDSKNPYKQMYVAN